MSDSDSISTLLYEALIFGRFQVGLNGRSRRTGGTLDQSAYTLLTILDVGGPASISDLAKTTGLETSTLQRQTAALVKAEYAVPTIDPQRGPARVFEISPHGLALLREEQEASRQGFESITTDWTDAEFQQLSTLLHKLNRSMEVHSGREWPRLP